MPLHIKTTVLLMLASILTSVSFTTTKAATLISYSFGVDSSSGTLTADIGPSLSAITWNSGGATGYANTFTGLGAALSVGSFQQGEYYQITLDATGYQTVVFNSFRANGTNTAPADWKISYSLAGTSGPFTDATTFSIQNATGSGSTTFAGFSLPGGADNNAGIVLRLIATTSNRVDATLTAANGTFRIDSLSFSAVAIPEHEMHVLAIGLVIFGWVVQRRRKLAHR